MVTYTVEIFDEEQFANRVLLPDEMKKKWIEALRSGEYPQIQDYLKTDKGYCCLGVLCEVLEIYNVKFEFDNGYAFGVTQTTCTLPDFGNLRNLLDETGDFTGFTIVVHKQSSNHGCSSLAGCNDNGLSFEQIAEIISNYF